MNTLSWCQTILKNPKSQRQLENAVERFLEGPLSGMREYEKEKAIKLFSESVRDLENYLLYKYRIHPHKLDLIAFNQEQYIQNFMEVEKLVELEINKQANRYNVLFSETSTDETWEVENNILNNKKSQIHLEERMNSLLSGILSNKGTFVKEVFVEAFTEPMRNLENALLYARNIHPEQMPITNSQQYKENESEVEKIMKVEIGRQHRHFLLVF